MTLKTKLRVLFVMALASWVMLGVIVAIEHRDINDSRAASWRLCARQNQTRAELHSIAGDYAPLKDVRSKRVEAQLPIFDCEPNLDGNAAVPLKPYQQRFFVRQYQQGKLKVSPDPKDQVRFPR
jgi:hypothetical protein